MKQPYYTLELSASSCSFDVLINDLPIISMQIEGQASPNLPINHAITKSGLQEIKITMKPLKGQLIFEPDALIRYNIRIYDVYEDEFKFIKDYDIYEIKKTKNNYSIPIIEINKFEANIDYEITSWETGINYDEIEELENKLKLAYDNVFNMLIRKEFVSFYESILIRENNFCKSMYLSDNESKTRINSLINDINNGFEILPIPKNAIIKIYGNGKIFSYKNLNNEPIISFYNKKTNEQLMLEIMFYMPNKNSNLTII
ncbi:hypothetical protein BWK58_14715 [Flavobacterium columnare]|nr:hypothetical protein BWK58_14715 [Flavobacterium columnare]